MNPLSRLATDFSTMVSLATQSHMRMPGVKPDGTYVAEVWLEWPICTGSTLYRQRFSSYESATNAVRVAAKLLDECLPRKYRDTDYLGRSIYLDYDYGIHFRVRQATPSDTTDEIWSPNLPGHREFNGEHASAHPLMRDPAKSASALGYKT